VRVSVLRSGHVQGRFALLVVTTLQRLLLGSHFTEQAGVRPGSLKLMLVDHRPLSLLRAGLAGLFGRLGREVVSGVHVERGDEIRIEGERSSVILDGELFQASPGRPIVLTPTAPVPFLSLAA
jgi:hypothetical protein